VGDAGGAELGTLDAPTQPARKNTDENKTATILLKKAIAFI
jgi:hypothetical protein